MPDLLKGVLASVFAQCAFGFLYWYSEQLAPLSGTAIFSVRMPLMLIGLLAIGSVLIGKAGFARFARFYLSSRRGWAKMLFGSVLLNVQMWLFMWAPVNGEAVNTAMGYFLFPLVMVLAGWLMGERLNRLQTAALFAAAAGVAHEFFTAGSMSWTTFLVALGFPPYFIMRRRMGVGAIQGLTFDIAAVTPFCLIWLLFFHPDTARMIAETPRYYWMLPLLGALSALSQAANVRASAMLPVNLYGLLSYLEPALMFVAAVVFLGAPLAESALWTYGLIWLSLMLLGVNAFIAWRRNTRLRKEGRAVALPPLHRR